MGDSSRVAKSMVGVVDSGAGGLSFVRELFERFPGHEVLYFADTEFFPYGVRSNQEIRERVITISKELIGLGAKSLVLACNTATAAAVDYLRGEVEIPVIGVEPPIKPACKRWRRVLALVTPATARSERFERLCRLHGVGRELVVRPCPGLAELIERTEGGLGGPIKEYFGEDPGEAEAIVLGCTHYELAREEIRSVFGQQVEIFSPSTGAANRFAALVASTVEGRKNRFALVSGNEHCLRLARQFIGDFVVEAGCDTVSTSFG